MRHNLYSITYEVLIQPGHRDQRRCRRRTDDPRPRLPCSEGRRTPGRILCECEFTSLNLSCELLNINSMRISLGRNRFAETVRARLHGRRMGENVSREYNVVFPRHQVRSARDADH